MKSILCFLLVALGAGVANADEYDVWRRDFYARWQAESLADIAWSLRGDCYYDQPVYYGPSDSQMRYYAKVQALHTKALRAKRESRKERKARIRRNNRAKLQAKSKAVYK